MKYIRNKFTKGAVAVLLMVTAASCKKGIFYPGINTNPTQLTNPEPSFLLPNIISGEGYEWGGDAGRFTSLFMNSVVGNGNQTLPYQNYIVTPSDVDGMWTDGLYVPIMNNANQLISVAAAKGQSNYEAIGKILMANALGLTTDMWGDVPYSEAFKGALNIAPHYDAQKTIYADLDGLLNDAITEIAANTGNTPSSDDILYGGDMSKWLAFAYSLKAKFYLHLVKTDASYYAKALAAAANGFKSSADDAIVPFLGASIPSQSPWYQENSQRPGDIVYSGFIYNLMLPADPRATAAVFGDGQGDLGALYGSANSGIPLMTYDELLFDEAEATFQTAGGATAAPIYTAAVTANLARTTGSGAYAATIVAAKPVSLANIMTQKYIAEYLNPEVWTDWRRTGFPALTPSPNGQANGQIPRSLLYPQTEVNENPNTPAKANSLVRVWWDVQ